MDNYYKTIKLIFKIFHVVTGQDCKVYGELNTPPGAKIIAGNHPNATDGFYLLFFFKEQLYFFVQGDLFNIPFIGWLFKHSGQIKVDPEKKKLAFEQGVRFLEQDKPVAIFPEARLNPDGQPTKSHTGAIRLALRSGAAIIPIGFYVPPENLQYMKRMKNGRVSQGHWQRRGHCYLHIGSPWRVQDELTVPADQADVPLLTEQLMGKINDQALLAMQAYERESGQAADLASFDQH
jgi:1-acyl-sn-glycerol-3-phosphate acyltransferase